MRLIISTVGTSLLEHSLGHDENLRRQFRGYTNAREEKEIDATFYDLVNQRISKSMALLRQEVENGRTENFKKMSAELNGLLTFYETYEAYGPCAASSCSGKHITGAGRRPGARRGFLPPGDVQILVATDTVWGRMAAEAVKELILLLGGTVGASIIPKKLSTRSTGDFVNGVKELIRLCEEIIDGYRRDQYEICFNLTGGFKSLQGYMNTIGMLLADKIFYIFETANQLIEIPRLPVIPDVSVVEKYKVWLAMMEENYLCPLEKVEGLPPVLIDEDGKHATLSLWGELVWGRIADELYVKELFPFPWLKYQPEFRKDFLTADPVQKRKLQKTLARVATLLEESNGNLVRLRGDNGLKYEDYTHSKKGMAHFRVDRGWRVCCRWENGELVLYRFGREPEVNTTCP